MLARIRFDDVLWQSGDPKLDGKELDRFKLHLKWCQDLDVILAPNIICTELQKFPAAIEFLNNAVTNDERMTLDLHGWDHGPYAPRTEDECMEHLERSLAWFDKHLEGVTPTRWVTPHGAYTRAMENAARRAGMTIETTADPVVDQREADKILRVTRDLSKLNDKVIMVHWWERGMALYRIVQIYKHGDVHRAVMASTEDLEDSAHKACWGKGWERLTQ